MSLRVVSVYEQNQFGSLCTICGRTTGGRPPVRHILVDNEEQIGDVCERCAYGSVDLWRVALIDYSIRLETKAAVLRTLAARLDDAEPAPEGIVEDLIRENMSRQQRPGLPPWLRGPGD